MEMLPDLGGFKEITMMLKVLAWTGLVLGGTTAAHAAGKLQATLLQADAGHPTKLVLTLTNTGDKPLSFERYTTPLVLLDGEHTSFPQFDVNDVATSERARYKGYFVNIIGHPEENYMTMAPGQSEVANYDLAPDFEMLPGKTYRVTFHMSLGKAPEDGNGIAVPNSLHIAPEQKILSNTVLVSVPLSARTDGALAPAATNPPITDAKKLKELDDAVYYGYYYMANPAWVHYSDGLPSFGDANAKGSIHSHQYKTWFGTYNENDANDRLVTGTLRALADRLNQGLHGTARHKFKWVENCPTAIASGTAAIAHTGSVQESGVYEIVLCDLFWTLAPKPVKGQPAASQAATIVHEASHFGDLPSDFLGWPNQTYDYTYGRADSQKLVLDNREHAVANADNFEYFIVDVMEYF